MRSHLQCVTCMSCGEAVCKSFRPSPNLPSPTRIGLTCVDAHAGGIDVSMRESKVSNGGPHNYHLGAVCHRIVASAGLRHAKLTVSRCDDGGTSLVMQPSICKQAKTVNAQTHFGRIGLNLACRQSCRSSDCSNFFGLRLPNSDVWRPCPVVFGETLVNLTRRSPRSGQLRKFWGWLLQGFWDVPLYTNSPS